MRAEILYEAITLIDDDLIDEAGVYAPGKKKPASWKRWAALAACLVLVVGLGGGAFLLLFGGGMGGASSGGGAGGGGADGSSTFMSYAGPVFPLTTTENIDGITARRDITLDFAPWVPNWISNEEEAASRADLTEAERADVLENYNEWYPEGGRYTSSSDILVTDSYTLTNSTAEDKTLTLLYPFVSNLRELEELRPTLSVDGEEEESELLIGPYSGGFEGAWGSENTEETLNLDQLNSWEEYKALLSDGAYLEKTMGDYPDFTGVEAIVYELTGPWGSEETDDVPNPTIRVTFDMDYDHTTVLTYGFHGASYDREGGRMGQSFSIPQEWEPDSGQPYYLIILGEDVANMEMEGYVTGGWDTREKLEEFGVDVRRYETDLDTILRQVVELMRGERTRSGILDQESAVDFETYYGLFCDYLATYGPLSENGMDRYDTGWLEELGDVDSVARVCYLQAQVTIPAGESAQVSAAMTKPPSYDHYCADTENQGVDGYDMVTRLGSTLTFTGQTAALEDHGQIEIVRQNFGFDLDNGVKAVELDPAVEHYYLEGRPLEQPEEE